MLRLYFVFIDETNTVTHTLKETLPMQQQQQQQTVLRKDLVDLIKPKLKQDLRHYKLVSLLRYQVDLIQEEVEDFVCNDDDDDNDDDNEDNEDNEDEDDDEYYIDRFLKKEKQLTDLHFPLPCDQVFNDLLTLWVILKEEPLIFQSHRQSRKKHHGPHPHNDKKQTRRRH